jgi:hypothetical protein
MSKMLGKISNKPKKDLPGLFKSIKKCILLS